MDTKVEVAIDLETGFTPEVRWAELHFNKRLSDSDRDSIEGALKRIDGIEDVYVHAYSCGITRAKLFDADVVHQQVKQVLLDHFA